MSLSGLLQLLSELLAYGTSSLCLFSCELIKDRSHKVAQVHSVDRSCLLIMLIAKAITSLAEEVVVLDDAVWDTIASSCQLQFTQCSLMCVKHDLVQASSNNEQLLVHQLIM